MHEEVIDGLNTRDGKATLFGKHTAFWDPIREGGGTRVGGMGAV